MKAAPENQRPAEAYDDGAADLVFSKRHCCSWIPFLDSGRGSSGIGAVWWGRIRKADSEEGWWKRGWRRVREWSEVVAGPRWKTFLRRFQRKGKNGARQGKFQYDPLSYAMNFDEGQNVELDDDTGYRDFSARFAVPPVSAKSSMDFGRNEPDFTAPHFTAPPAGSLL